MDRRLAASMNFKRKALTSVGATLKFVTAGACTGFSGGDEVLTREWFCGMEETPLL